MGVRRRSPRTPSDDFCVLGCVSCQHLSNHHLDREPESSKGADSLPTSPLTTPTKNASQAEAPVKENKAPPPAEETVPTKPATVAKEPVAQEQEEDDDGFQTVTSKREPRSLFGRPNLCWLDVSSGTELGGGCGCRPPDAQQSLRSQGLRRPRTTKACKEAHSSPAANETHVAVVHDPPQSYSLAASLGSSRSPRSRAESCSRPTARTRSGSHASTGW